MALTKSAEIFPALRIPHFIVVPLLDDSLEDVEAAIVCFFLNVFQWILEKVILWQVN